MELRSIYLSIDCAYILYLVIFFVKNQTLEYSF